MGWTFDKTLATKPGGRPIGPMVERVKRWLGAGKSVRVITARPPSEHPRIARWTEKHVGKKLPVQQHKTPSMIRLYDDRVRAVKANKGVPK